MRRAGPADGLRLAVGTLTVVRVRPPTKVDRAVAGPAMLWAAPVGLLLGAAAGLVLEGARAASHHSVAGVFLASVLAIATLAVLTSGRHLDGLADTADALASRRAAPAALEIMRRGDVGPVGVVTLLLVLGVQVFAVAESVGRGNGWLCLVVAVVTGRIALTWGCTTHVPAARFTGLGAAVAGTLRVRTPFVVTALGALLAAAISALDDDRGISLALRSAAAVVAGVAGTLLLLQRCVARFGGVTGDVLGALVECATTIALLCFSLL